MTLDGLRRFYRSLPGATEDVKWGHDLCFSVGGRMYAAVNLDPPHQVSVKCTPEMIAELTEREGIIPAPYAARHMWVQEEKLGAALERREVETLIRRSYELVAARLPKSEATGCGREGGLEVDIEARGDSPQEAHTRAFAAVEVTATFRVRSRENIRKLAWPARCSLRGHGSCRIRSSRCSRPQSAADSRYLQLLRRPVSAVSVH